MTFKRAYTLLPIFLLGILTSCHDKNNSILYNKNFEDGKWLLVVENHADKSLFIIDDETVLKSNIDGIKSGSKADCGGTTCDGFITLYRDGEIVATKEFLSKTELLENNHIKNAYKKAKRICIIPDQRMFKQIWDSLETVKNNYPTRRNIKPENKDIICFYHYDYPATCN